MAVISLAAFLTTWVIVAVLIDRLDRAHKRPLVERLMPYVNTGEASWVRDVEDWLHRH